MGMIKIPNKSINFFKSNLDEIFNSGNLAEGIWNTKISEFTKDLTGAKTALPTNSNGSGMVALMTIYRHYYGRTNVLIQSNTMYGVKTMVFASGCNLSGYIQCQLTSLMPSLQDVELSIKNMNQIEKEKTIIVLSHIGGIINPDIENIALLCREENIILLEDAAHSFGATLNGKHSGLFGDAGVYSFYATKAIPVGEGGIVVTNNREIGEMIKDFSIYDRFKQKLGVGNNIRISEVQALLAFSVVKEWENIVANKSLIAKKYMDACDKTSISYITQNKNGHKGNYYKFIVYSSDAPISEAFPTLTTTTSPVYDYAIGVPNSLAGYHACLPIWYGQEKDITNKVVSELLKS